MEKITDIELHAYVDNELDASQHDRMTMAANSDPALKEKIATIQALKIGISESFAQIQSDTPPSYLVDTVTEKPQRKFQHWAAAACLFAGVAGGYLWGQHGINKSVPLEQDWIAQVVNYQDMYTTDTLAHVVSSSNERDTTLARLSSAVQHDIIIPEFPNKDVEFKRGQILTSQQNPVIQLAFLDTATGTPIALCITPSDKSITAMANGSIHGMNYINWSDGELEFLVVGDLSHDQLQIMAQDARTQYFDAV